MSTTGTADPSTLDRTPTPAPCAAAIAQLATKPSMPPPCRTTRGSALTIDQPSPTALAFGPNLSGCGSRISATTLLHSSGWARAATRRQMAPQPPREVLPARGQATRWTVNPGAGVVLRLQLTQSYGPIDPDMDGDGPLKDAGIVREASRPQLQRIQDELVHRDLVAPSSDNLEQPSGDDDSDVAVGVALTRRSENRSSGIRRICSIRLSGPSPMPGSRSRTQSPTRPLQ